MSLEQQIANQSLLLNQVMQQIVCVRHDLSALKESPMSDAEICNWLHIVPATLRNYRKHKEFPSFPSRTNIENWYAMGNGKGKKRA